MEQAERRAYLIKALLAERYEGMTIPEELSRQRLLLRALLNVRPPEPVSDAFLRVQDAYLREELARKGVTDAETLPDVREGLCLWRGDITALRCDAIVNAANSALLGCFCPNHGCIDNAIHTFAGVQLRLYCARLIKEQGSEEAAGRAKLTPAFNLPSRCVLHTVGPMVNGKATPNDCETLASCYRACLDLADAKRLHSVAFCCISTGEFGFPNELAAKIAVDTACAHKSVREKRIRVIFNVFKELDESIYRRLLAVD